MTGPERPLVVACLTHVDPRPSVDPLSGEIGVDSLAAGPSAAELAALEHALRIADAWEGQALAVVAGPAAADTTLRLAGAAGADMLRVPWAPGGDDLSDLAGDAQPLAAALSSAILAVGQPAVVICGDRSSHRGTGVVPALVAHELGAAQALGLVGLAVDDVSLVGERRLEAGRRERLRIRPPAVVSVEAAGVRLRRASLPAVIAANRAAVPVAAVPPRLPRATVRVGPPRPFRPRPRVIPPPEGTGPQQRVLTLTGVHTRLDPPAIVGPLDPQAAAEAIVAFLRTHGYLE